MKYIPKDQDGHSLCDGAEYLLKTECEDGYYKPKSDWIKVVWDGRRFMDKDGVTWNEWLGFPEDIVKEK